MKINILLPFKEKFEKDKASSVSITVCNNLHHTKYLKNTRVFGQDIDKPLFKPNFIGIKYSCFSFKSKNKFLAEQMLKIILKDNDNKQILEIHNRPYLINVIYKMSISYPITLFFHNNPKTMKGSKTVIERETILENCSAVFCVSNYIKNQFLDGIKNNCEKVHVLYNGVDRKLKKLPKKKKEIIFVGRLVKEKGLHLFVEVAYSVASKFPNWSFSIIGSYKLGDNHLRNSYAKNMISKFKKIGPQTKFHGFKDQDFVQEQMKNGAIIIIPSLWEEPFGLVAAEAMSNGMAIIASKVGGIPEIITENGIIIEDINSEKIETELIDLIENDDKRKILQRKAWDNFKFSSLKSSKTLDNYRNIIIKNFV